MDDDDQALWDRLVRDLEIPPDLREHIANMAEREDETPLGLHPARAPA